MLTAVKHYLLYFITNIYIDTGIYYHMVLFQTSLTSLTGLCLLLLLLSRLLFLAFFFFLDLGTSSTSDTASSGSSSSAGDMLLLVGRRQCVCTRTGAVLQARGRSEGTAHWHDLADVRARPHTHTGAPWMPQQHRLKLVFETLTVHARTHENTHNVCGIKNAEIKKRSVNTCLPS